MQKARSHGIFSAVLAASLGRAVPVHAADETMRACVDAHEQGQVERGAGQLLAARQRFLSCSQVSCPLVVRKECLDFAEQLAPQVPSVVLVAVDPRGHEVPLASAVIDASWSRDRDFGMALELDPGSHEIVLQAIDGRAAHKTFLLRAGEQLRRLVVEFPARRVQADERKASAPSMLPYVVGGVGLLALGSFIGFALDGKAAERDLEACKPDCTRAGVDRMRRSYLIADISLAVAAVAVGVDTYLILTPPVASQGAFGVSAVGRF